jgi:hypothetical protein
MCRIPNFTLAFSSLSVGCSFAFGCISLDTQTGGYFSCELLDMTNKWTTTPSHNNYLSIHGEFERARHTIASQPNPPQQPYLWDSLTSRHHSFPFAFLVPVAVL